MCVSPNKVWLQQDIDLWVEVELPCRTCWRCIRNKINDMVGRGLCEAAYSDATVALTLTYRDQPDLSHMVLTPDHFSKFVRALRKRLRKAGGTLRYIVAGEYGERKGRAHFHCVLFFKGTPPQFPQGVRFWDDAWPHGHIWADWNVDHKALRYVLKYIQKEDGRASWFSLSKKPTIGREFFMDKAVELFSLGLMPRSFFYLPPFGRRDQEYIMTGVTRRDFLLDLVDLYDSAGVPLPEMEEGIAEAVDRAVRQRIAWESVTGPMRPSEKARLYERAKKAEAIERLTGRAPAAYLDGER